MAAAWLEWLCVPGTSAVPTPKMLQEAWAPQAKTELFPFPPGQPLFTLGSFYHLRSMLHLAPELQAEKLWLQSPSCLPPPQRGAG